MDYTLTERRRKTEEEREEGNKAFDSSADVCVEDCEDGRHKANAASLTRPTQKKLWSKGEQFPWGVVCPRNYEVADLLAAQCWQCPCRD
eukprot:143837-Pleurochrysis_carterae.AAC.4